jgi:DnaJ domain
MRKEEAWRVLGLPGQPSAREVKSAFRRLAKSTHPDAIGGGRTASQFARITEAYEVALADAIAAGRIGAPTRDLPPARTAPAPAPRRTPQPAQPSAGTQSTASAHPGSTTYDGATEAEPVWDGAAWVGADSGTYWTVNPREYADPRKHGPEYRARGRRPVRRTPRERTTAQPAPRPQTAETRGVARSTSLAVGAASLVLITVLVSGSLRLLAAAALCALLAYVALNARRR